MIAVDGGYDTCRKYDIVPDLIVGDFDSVQESDMPQIAEIAKFAPDHVVVLPTEKDDTDMLAAIRIGLGEGCQCWSFQKSVQHFCPVRYRPECLLF